MQLIPFYMQIKASLKHTLEHIFTRVNLQKFMGALAHLLFLHMVSFDSSPMSNAIGAKNTESSKSKISLFWCHSFYKNRISSSVSAAVKTTAMIWTLNAQLYKWLLGWSIMNAHCCWSVVFYSQEFLIFLKYICTKQ